MPVGPQDSGRQWPEPWTAARRLSIHSADQPYHQSRLRAPICNLKFRISAHWSWSCAIRNLECQISARQRPAHSYNPPPTPRRHRILNPHESALVRSPSARRQFPVSYEPRSIQNRETPRYLLVYGVPLHRMLLMFVPIFLLKYWTKGDDNHGKAIAAPRLTVTEL